MKQIVKQALATAALSVMAVGLVVPGTAEAKKGQKNDVIKPDPEPLPTETKRSAHSGPGGTSTPPGDRIPPSTERNKSDTIKPNPDTTARPKRKGPKERDNTYSTTSRSTAPSSGAPSAAKGGKTGWILGVGGLAAIATIVAVSGKGTPVSR